MAFKTEIYDDDDDDDDSTSELWPWVQISEMNREIDCLIGP